PQTSKPTTPSNQKSNSNAKSSTPGQYDFIKQLATTPTHISLMELLKESPSFQDILTHALNESRVPHTLNVQQFQAMIANLTPETPILSFGPQDMLNPNLINNNSLYIEAYVTNHKVKRVLIDNGATLNICSIKMLCCLGHTIDDLDANIITIH
ncbi:hypothetical protein KI387_039395, partial [Taxus chinensis]